MKALIVGPGNVGKALSRVLAVKSWEHEFFFSKNDPDSFTRAAQTVDIVFLAIPTKDRGESELAYLTRCIELGIPAVTCAKGALAYHFEKLMPHLDRFGFTATVGGGSEILPLAIGHPSDPIMEIRAIQNGTVNFFCWGMQGGMENEEATLAEARRRNLPEPGAVGLKGMFDAESLDKRMKAAITFNLARLNGIVSPHDFNYSTFEEGLIRSLLSKPGSRFVLEIREVIDYRFSFEPFSLHRKPWLILGSFVQNAQEMFPKLGIHEESNAIVVKRKHTGLHLKGGRGAGAIPTAETMLRDALHLLRNK